MFSDADKQAAGDAYAAKTTISRPNKGKSLVDRIKL
jgi:hypothetical protein